MNITKSKNITNGETSSFLLNIKKYKYFYILLLPAILYTFIFNYLPLGGVIMAFQDFDIIKGFSGSEWVGLDNFIKIFTMPNFLLAIKNTFIYSGTILFLGFPLPIILALLFNELRNLRFKKVVQTISYMPYFLSWASVVALFYGFFAINGSFNDMRVWLFGEGIERINIFMDAGNFLKIIFFSHVWKNVGWNSVIFLASIAAISPSLYEAAIVDGCGRFKQIWYITLPSLLPTAIIILILNTGSLIVSNFEQVYGLQNLFIQEQTEVINTLVYRQGLNIGNYSLATAFGLTQGIVSFLIVFVVNKIAKKLSGISIW
ncbi:ABC transporter permease [Vallitalea guaymasensis]|uniref:Sugar ABC transporter permease n=1 Tax=Vallitalea guaymasensis TaxID=1185412 RepID=A0A8J8MBD8_9FIRM|nr:ABC transporter permease subunit [Vallitalea guaymasensis]QUH29787.1 sugar ABC transporter permease [Vallitalea guaymasensis]